VGAIDDVDKELLHLVAMGEEEKLALLHTVLREELRPSITEVALPLAIVVDLDPRSRASAGRRCTLAGTWPSIASTNLEGRRRRSPHPASTGIMKVMYPSTEEYAGG
jgi:hypothetical protein